MPRSAPPDQKGRTRNQQIEMAASRLAAERMLEIRSKFKDDEEYEGAIQEELANSFRDGIARWPQGVLTAYVNGQPFGKPGRWKLVTDHGQVVQNPKTGYPVSFAGPVGLREHLRGYVEGDKIFGIPMESLFVVSDNPPPLKVVDFLRSAEPGRWNLVTEMNTIVVHHDLDSRCSYSLSFPDRDGLVQYLKNNIKDGKVSGHPVDRLFVVFDPAPRKLVDFLRELEMEESGPGEEDGPWADGFAGRSGLKQCVITVAGPHFAGKTALVVAIRRYLSRFVKSLEVVDLDPHAVVFREAVDLNEILKQIDVRMLEKTVNVPGKAAPEEPFDPSVIPQVMKELDETPSAVDIVAAEPPDADCVVVGTKMEPQGYKIHSFKPKYPGKRMPALPELSTLTEVLARVRRYYVAGEAFSDAWPQGKEQCSEDFEVLGKIAMAIMVPECQTNPPRGKTGIVWIDNPPPPVPKPEKDSEQLYAETALRFLRALGAYRKGSSIVPGVDCSDEERTAARADKKSVTIDSIEFVLRLGPPEPKPSPALQPGVLLGREACPEPEEVAIARVAHELETLRLKLAAISTFAQADTPESAERARANVCSEYMSEPARMVIALVDEVMKLRSQVKRLEALRTHPPIPSGRVTLSTGQVELVRGIHRMSGGFYLVDGPRRTSLDPEADYAVCLGGLFLFYRAADNGPVDPSEKMDWLDRKILPTYKPKDLSLFPWGRIDGPWMLWKCTDAGLRPV